jgi:hypothetical protein
MHTVMQEQASRVFAVNFIAHSISAPKAAEGQLLLLCLPTNGQEECALITAFKWGYDKSLGALALILFCTRVESS